MQPKSVYIETYGCSNNQAESQMMKGLLEKSGFLLTNDETRADIVIVNTCSVKNKTESKIMHRLSSFHEKYRDKKLIVAGCLPEANIERVRKIAKNASIVGTNHIRKIAVAADLLLDGTYVEFVGKANVEKVGLPKIRENDVVDIIPISNGCMSHCSFCSTKLAKGDLFSYGEEKIIEEIRAAKIGGGAKEFWLTSQDCGCYGFDANTNAATLLNKIAASVSGVYFLRLGMANPQHVKLILNQLIDAYKDGHVFKFLHVPVQSGSNKILRTMARGHTVEDYKNVVGAFRSILPEITIWTDIIVGFPGETEEDFEETVNLVKETRPDVANISAYSARPGTKSAKMKKVPTEIVKERTVKMHLLAKQIALEQNSKWLGWSGTVIIDEYKPEKNSYIGRNYAYKPVVLEGNNDYSLGQVIDIKVFQSTTNCLIGKEADGSTDEIMPWTAAFSAQ